MQNFQGAKDVPFLAGLLDIRGVGPALIGELYACGVRDEESYRDGGWRFEACREFPVAIARINETIGFEGWEPERSQPPVPHPYIADPGSVVYHLTGTHYRDHGRVRINTACANSPIDSKFYDTPPDGKRFCQACSNNIDLETVKHG